MPLSPVHSPESDTLASLEMDALSRRACTLRQAAREGRLPALMKGRRLGVLCDPAAPGEALLVQRAAMELGAEVSLVHPGFEVESGRATMVHTARMLGRLYDLVACPALAPEVARQLRAEAGIPVVDDGCIAAIRRAARQADECGDAAPPAEEARVLWQAALVASLDRQ